MSSFISSLSDLFNAYSELILCAKYWAGDGSIAANKERIIKHGEIGLKKTFDDCNYIDLCPIISFIISQFTNKISQYLCC